MRGRWARRAVVFIVDKRREDSVTAKDRGGEELVSSLSGIVEGLQTD